ncbi:regulator of G protein-like protein [Leptodontidium sp. MPI-SDFR-AT-0119]|nr:regulator of G protein-like protein [Leptodontidium sp. MPI-SDFR-AT-0119]
MSVLFYRRPDYFHMPPGPINAKDCTRYLERAKTCSLNDFMDYLAYVEFNAENLQFYLWYRDYVRRFEALPETEKALSPEFVPEADKIPDLNKAVEKGGRRKTKRGASTALMGTGYVRKDSVLSTSASQSLPHGQGQVTINNEDELTGSPSVTSGSTAVPSDAEVMAQAGLKWQPCASVTIQPMREEIIRVMRHYLAFTAPRELNISHRDRAHYLHALQHTTHPSALAPAVKIAEAALRGQSHPNFIRWSICNGNKPRAFFVRTIGVANITLCFVITTVLTLSIVSRWWRIFATVEWFGFAFLHHSYARNLRPWEQDLDSEIGDMRRNSSASTENRAVQMSSRMGDHEDQIVFGANIWALIITIPLTVAFVALPKGKFF